MDPNTLLSPAKTAENWTSARQSIADGMISRDLCDMSTTSFTACRNDYLQTVAVNNALDGLTFGLAFIFGFVATYGIIKKRREHQRLRTVFSA